MKNKVVSTLFRAFDARNATVRFNFRGVGLSEGRMDGIGGQDDLRAVMSWVILNFQVSK